MNCPPTIGSRLEFRAGDAVVVLHHGRNNGMPGHFVGLRVDPNWADIEESDGLVRSHPVLWLRRADDFPDVAAKRG